MGFTIIDPLSSESARVIDNRLLTKTISQTPEHHENVENKAAWNILVQQTPTGASDNFFYFKNTDTKKYVMEGIDYRVASAEQVLIILNMTGAPSGGTAITPVGANTATSVGPTATIESGNDITGLSAGSTQKRLFCTSTETKPFNFVQDLVIEPGGVVVFQAVAGSIQIDMIIHLHKISAEIE
jgi:hypothetical protein